MDADVVVIGGGLSGLVTSALLAETGRRVVLLERHYALGGCLQRFVRRGVRFDTGFHYFGQSDRGRPMRRMLERLGVWHALTPVMLSEDAAFDVREGSRAFCIPGRFERFLERAAVNWPGERAALGAFATDTDAEISRHRWFALREPEHEATHVEASRTFADYARERFGDPALGRLLGRFALNLGLRADEVPFYKFALAFRGVLDATSRLVGGGGALVRALAERARALGVDVRTRREVVRLRCSDGRAIVAETACGERLAADLFVATCHPKVIVRALDADAIRPVFREHVMEYRESRGAVQAFARLRFRPPAGTPTCVLVCDDEGTATIPPLGGALIVVPDEAEDAEAGGPRLEVLAYVDYAPFAACARRSPVASGPDYELLKDAYANRLVALAERALPGISALIIDRYAATPLTTERFTANEHGGAFGVSHDVGQTGAHRPQPRLRLRNLVFAGHSVHLPGVMGVMINAFETCARLPGGEGLFRSVAGHCIP